MKRIYKNIMGLAVVAATLTGVQSCTAEEDFTFDGEGAVSLNVSLNSRITRAMMTQDDLKKNCVVRISDDKGLLHRWQNLDSVPNQVFLKYGAYKAVAWSGEKADVSTDKIYYEGETAFTVAKGSANTQVQILCKIMNTVISVDIEDVRKTLAEDTPTVVEVTSSKGGDTISSVNPAKKIFFLMPEGETKLHYKVTGKNKLNKEIKQEGDIENVKPTHEYRLKLTNGTSASPNTGGSVFDISIEEAPIVDDVAVIYGNPQFSWVNGQSLTEQLIKPEGGFKQDEVLRIAYFGKITSLKLITENAAIKAVMNNNSSMDIVNCTAIEDAAIRNLGITHWDMDGENGQVTTYLQFSKDWLNSIAESDDPYVLKVEAVTEIEGNTKIGEYEIGIATTDKAIRYADPVVVDSDFAKTDLTAVSATSATIPVRISGNDIPSDAKLNYREQGDENWMSVPVNVTRADVLVNVSGLKEATSYEYCLSWTDASGNAQTSEISTFTTESKFVIPNASFEEWSSYSAKTILGTKNVVLPGNSGDKTTSYWGSGNEGSATANKQVLLQSSDMVHSGSNSAKLASASAVGVIAAGNIFTGYYVKTDGTNGVLSVGREYNGSHPTKLKVWANYRPGGSVSIKDGQESNVEIVSGGTDHGQIYIALTTEAVEIRTNPSDQKLFSKDDPVVVAYGQVTWKEAFGSDGQLQMVEIPFEYNARAKSSKPTHLVIVASACKFGDYFCGSASSVMYLDDFELVYE